MDQFDDGVGERCVGGVHPQRNKALDSFYLSGCEQLSIRINLHPMLSRGANNLLVSC